MENLIQPLPPPNFPNGLWGGEYGDIDQPGLSSSVPLVWLRFDLLLTNEDMYVIGGYNDNIATCFHKRIDFYDIILIF